MAALGAAFVAVYLGRTRTAGVTRALLLAALVVLWLGLLLVGADASYASVGLFLVPVSYTHLTLPTKRIV